MHRWLIAIFALHFLLNVSAFSLGESSHRTTILALNNATTVPTPAADCSDVRTETPAQVPLKHGLMDELPDLPDTLSLSVSVLKQPVEPGRAIRFMSAHGAPPLLDTPLRPPQAPRA